MHLKGFENIEKILEITRNIDFAQLDNPELFTEEVGGWASKVAKIQEVRDFLLKLQKDFCNLESGAILDGRDIGTTICPEAKYKFFITATAEERANRRYKELIEKGEVADLDKIEADIIERDERDMNRDIAPLKQADDAVLVDSSFMTIDEVVATIMSEAEKIV